MENNILYCIGNCKLFEKDKAYIFVDLITDDDILLGTLYTYVLDSVDTDEREFFYLTNKNEFPTYFCGVKEYRKLKLEKLNE